jgi:hypothetical protein
MIGSRGGRGEKGEPPICADLRGWKRMAPVCADTQTGWVFLGGGEGNC